MAIRDIIFRGKRIDNGEWVEGNLITGKWYINEREIVAIAPLDNAFYPHCEMSEWYEVDPTTVGQYTGLTDKNGKKIFEGDRIEIRGYVYYCCWDVGNLEFILINEKESFGMGYAASSRMTVIGNVHDNPGLWGRADNGT